MASRFQIHLKPRRNQFGSKTILGGAARSAVVLRSSLVSDSQDPRALSPPKPPRYLLPEPYIGSSCRASSFPTALPGLSVVCAQPISIYRMGDSSGREGAATSCTPMNAQTHREVGGRGGGGEPAAVSEPIRDHQRLAAREAVSRAHASPRWRPRRMAVH